MLKKILPVSLLAMTIFSSSALANEMKVYQGLGKATNFRTGPGKDSEGTPVYSFNYVDAAVLFDSEGKIINAVVDTLEVSTPNYDGESMPHFSGWPGTEGYNVSDHKTKKVSGKSENTPENLTKEVKEWKTKRERGASYGMNPKNEWDEQMDFFQEKFKGKTVDELELIFTKMYSDVNGRPLKENSKNEKDKEKYSKLTEAEKKEVADITAGATMSIRDSHGDILGAIKNAYDNRVEVIIPTK
ncbi:FMN-binding protein [Cetobacterium sp.]|uniref:FMN-binding protein n=1 Tax=Cetobacterium sp. TaxID=2071632 RepID=UPI002FC76053